jgi:hypothetical protein
MLIGFGPQIYGALGARIPEASAFLLEHRIRRFGQPLVSRQSHRHRPRNGRYEIGAPDCGFPGGRRVAAISNPDIWVGTDSEVRNSWCRNSDADLLHFRYHRNGGASAIRPKPGSFHVTLSSLRLQWRLFYRILTVASL